MMKVVSRVRVDSRLVPRTEPRFDRLVPFVRDWFVISILQQHEQDVRTSGNMTWKVIDVITDQHHVMLRHPLSHGNQNVYK